MQLGTVFADNGIANPALFNTVIAWLLCCCAGSADGVFLAKPQCRSRGQSAGSVGKGTSTTFSADLDTFVQHVGVVTQQQRMKFAQQVLVNFERSNIASRAQLHERRIRFYEVYVDM